MEKTPIVVVPMKVGDEIQMHIVDGCHPDQKLFPFNKQIVCWCCSGCISFYVELFAVFMAGKKSIDILKRHYRSGDGNQQFYQTQMTNEELSQSIPTSF